MASKKLNNHEDRQHAVLSASSAHRWLACPPSAFAALAYEDTSSVYAEEGTLAHEVAEAVVSNPSLNRFDFANEKITDDIIDAIATYRSFFAMQDLMREIDKYVEKYNDQNAQRIMIFTGHSRGAAIANILAKLYADIGVDVKSYGFNSPTVTKESNDTSKYHNIFTFITSNDLKNSQRSL